MSDPFLGEIKMVGFNFAPTNWAACNGQLLSIAQNTALFSLLGTTYGGDGSTTFALPNLTGRIPMHVSSSHVQGESAGAETVQLLVSEIPSHSHRVTCSSQSSNQRSPSGGIPAQEATGVTAVYATSDKANAQMAPETIASSGSGQPHNNLQPYLVVNFVIALAGIFPSRS